MVKFGVCLPAFAGGSAYTNDIDFNGLAEYALRAESLGYASLWAPDHFILGHEGGEHEVWTLLSALAARTSRIRLGALVLGNTHRNPALVAKMAATLDYLSGGRLDLGLGAGWHRREQLSYGLPWVEKVGERMDRLEEAIHVMKALFTQPDVDFDGEFYSARDAVCQPAPVQKPWPRLWIGGGGEKRTLRMTAEHADAWNVPALAPEEYTRKLGVLRGHCEDVGRDYGEIEKTMETRVLVADGRESTDRLVDWYIYWGRTADREMPSRDEIVAKLRQQYIIGPLDECVAKIGGYVDAGVQHFTIYFLDYPSTGSLDIFASDVMPRFR
ncbi:MAG: TIGR03560 family F420-dependent LLM class oxidoreductase [Chloroflexota bacterium]